MAKFTPGMAIRITLSSFSFLTVPVFLASLLVQLSECYPGGAPDQACSQLIPSHSGRPQTGSAPYLVGVSATNYVISGNLTVTLDTSTGHGFEGFLLQARLNGTTTTVGQFSTPSGSKRACQGTSVTHTNSNLKTSMSFNWSAPSTSTGDVVFVATFVKDYYTCWVSVSSTVVKATAAAATTTTTSTTTTSTTTTTTPTTTSTTKPSAPTTTTTVTSSSMHSYSSISGITTSKASSTLVLSDSTVQTTTTLNRFATLSSSTYAKPTQPSSKSSGVSTMLSTSSNMHSFGTPPSSSPTSSKSAMTGVSTIQSRSSNMTTTSFDSTPSSTYNVDVDISTCEKTKQCFLGDNCGSTTCDFVFTWADAGNNVAFELSGKVADQSSWLSVGLSYDDKMGNDSVTDCIVDSMGRVNVQMSWNPNKSNSPLTNGNLSLVDGTLSGGFANGRIFCRFSRPKFPISPNTNTEDQVYYPGSDMFYIFVGTGPMSNGVKLPHLKDPIISQSKQNLTDFSTTPAMVVDSSGCGKTKGCLKGKNCMNGVCDYILTWSNTGNDSIAFELSGVVHGLSSWLSFGMSLDDKMGSDSVTDCIFNPASGKVGVQMSWNPGKSNSPLNNKGLGLISGSMSGGYANGRIVCRFSRMKSSSNSTSRRKRQNSDQVYYPGAQSYYVFIANGLMSKGEKQTHSDQPIVSDSVIDLTSIGSYGGGASMAAKLIKAHGIIMLFAWLVFASFGMLMSRHFKTVWPGKTCCGKALWFQLHQPCMIITLLLSAAAFVIIFCKVLGYSEQISPANAHPPLGIIVMALVIINPVMSIFRCDPGAEHRWIFNMCHFGVGMLAQILSVVVIYLATYIQTAVSEEHLWCRWVLIAYICWHVLLEAAIVKQKTIMKDAAVTNLKNYQYSKQNYSLDDLVAGESTTDDQSTNPMPEPGGGHDTSSCATTFLVVMHLCVVVGCTVAMAVAVGLS